jgi:hypothetical protein
MPLFYAARSVTFIAQRSVDGDVILAAHAFLEAATGSQVEIATTNSADLARLFPNVLNWDDLK